MDTASIQNDTHRKLSQYGQDTATETAAPTISKIQKEEGRRKKFHKDLFFSTESSAAASAPPGLNAR
ncbi:unnamed protein product [Prunus armeniaca]|uniref:Uncharacterized protein n=1 Tax=Prunus armeniaca TaxID=36596 RepID=A0A6J5WI71_PRUAR|nr:unnamed protein product [Prunus armeniaca]